MPDGDFDEPVVYQIRVQGHLADPWTGCFDGMSAVAGLEADGSLVTILAGPVADQAALRGILNRIWDMNLTVVAVKRITPGSPRPEEGQT